MDELEKTGNTNTSDLEYLKSNNTFIPSSKILEKVLERKCPTCSGKMRFSAEKVKLACDYCGYSEDFDKANDKVAEQSLDSFINLAVQSVPEKDEKHVYNCGSCGSKTIIGKTEVLVKCSFCGSKNVNEEAFEHNYFQPTGILPFKIPKSKAKNQFSKWIKKGIFTPSSLNTKAVLGELKGIYLPFWTYDAHTITQYQGYAGYNKSTTQQQIVNGKMTPVQVKKTEWEYKSGEKEIYFDDVLVNASKGLKQEETQSIYPFNLKEVVNFDPQLLLGWEAEVYSTDVKEGYKLAEKAMDNQINNVCLSLIGGDIQKDVHVFTNKSKQTFKHIIFPIWICTYFFNDKSFLFLINGQTGKIYGKKPNSPLKIALAIGLTILFIAILYFVATNR